MSDSCSSSIPRVTTASKSCLFNSFHNFKSFLELKLKRNLLLAAGLCMCMVWSVKMARWTFWTWTKIQLQHQTASLSAPDPTSLHLLLRQHDSIPAFKSYTARWHRVTYLATGPMESSPSQHQRFLSAWPPDHQAPWHRLCSSHMLSSQTLQIHNHRCWFKTHTNPNSNLSIHIFIFIRFFWFLTILTVKHRRCVSYPPGTLSGRPLLTQLAP